MYTVKLMIKNYILFKSFLIGLVATQIACPMPIQSGSFDTLVANLW